MMLKFTLVIAALLLFSCGGEIKNVSYSEDVKPILKEYCMDCHNVEQKQGGLNFSSYESLMESRYLNRNQPVVIANDAKVSRLYLVIHSNKPAIRMPPPNFGYDRLSDREIETIKVWINEGAKNN